MMKKVFVLALAAAVLFGFAAVALACPGEAAAAGGCPFHTPNSFDKKLSVGDKFKCAQCGMEAAVSNDTPMIEHGGRYYYFMTPQCKDTFQKRVDEFYKGKEKI